MKLFVPWEIEWNDFISNGKMGLKAGAMVKLRNTHFRAIWTFVRLALISIMVGGFGLLFNACQAPEISDNNSTPIDTSDSGLATLRISNRISQDPGPLTFYLYPKNSVDFVNATNGRLLGKVEAGLTETFKVPAGSWKIAYQDQAKALFQMVDAASGGQEWLRSEFKKDGDYSLILNSDGNRTIWVPSYPTIPPIDRPL
jgi:hypothetical protein